MKRIHVEMTTNGNDSFFDDPTYEAVRVLRETADKLEAGHGIFRINDVNGNKCGEVFTSELED